jgi:folate-binding Fe-S cluster repair protein YgfZ
MTVSSSNKIATCFQLTVIVLIASFHGAVAFVPVLRHSNNKISSSNNKSINRIPIISNIIRGSTSSSYEYLPPNPDSPPGVFHIPTLKSSYPKNTPAGLRGEAVRSALLTTERCIGWDLATNVETSMGGLLEISGRGTIDFLNGKLTTSIDNSSNNNNAYREGCLLDAKGRLIDILRVTIVDDNIRALIMTSPGHSSTNLMKRLDPFVFPMDEVVLTNFVGNSADDDDDDDGNGGDDNDNRSFGFTLASTQYKHVQKVMREQSNLLDGLENDMSFPGRSQGVVWKYRNDGTEILVVPSTGLSSVACVGYTFVFFGNKSTGSDALSLGQQVWKHLISDANAEGPIEVGALEYETLRVEAGQPAYGCEYGIDRTKSKNEEEAKNQQEKSVVTEVDDNGNSNNQKKKKKKSTSSIIKTSPIELHLNSLIDENKGCYLGQEGIASVLKNPRGPPRKLYAVVFEDDFNIYDAQSSGDKSDFDNLTTLPKPGQKLYALGSNEELQVGTLTSVGESGGSGSPHSVALALVKRSDSIRKQMKEFDLEIPRDPDDFLDVDLSSGSGIIQPPSLDPLEGLEIIVEGTFTVGILKCVPSRRSGIGRNRNMFDEDIIVEGIPEHEAELPSSRNKNVDLEVDDEDDDSSASLEDLEAELKLAAAEAETAAAEAERKAEKMALLQQRAKEAMERRKQKKKE